MNRRGFLATVAAMFTGAWFARKPDVLFPQPDEGLGPYYEFGSNVIAMETVHAGGIYALTEDGIWHIPDIGGPATKISRFV